MGLRVGESYVEGPENKRILHTPEHPLRHMASPSSLRPHLVVFSGAGVSAASGIRTFRDHGGLWEEYPVEEVATPEGWIRDPERVLRFYDMRRRQVLAAAPNAAHFAIARLEKHFSVDVVTQNIDDLHERAGSSRVLHLHGEIRKARSTKDPSWVVELPGASLPLGMRCPIGSQLRPHIVWFGEPVPLIAEAAQRVARADVLIIVGTSLAVQPAASLVFAAPPHCEKFLVDPGEVDLHVPGTTHLRQKAEVGMPALADLLLKKWGP